MAGFSNVRAIDRPHTIELEMDAQNAEAEKEARPRKKHGVDLDSEESRKTHRKLLDWYFQEREKQAVNRYQQAVDHDFYDNLQWSQEDAEELMARGQAPLVYNEVAPMTDWMIGTERRTRVDWNILPRTEDDVEGADVKKNVMKYLADVNQAQFVRSRAFEDTVKAGIGWVEDGVSTDPTAEIIYSRYESWRYMLWDSAGSTEMDFSDGRYMFRWRWVDLDIAEAMFPDRKGHLRRAAVAAQSHSEDEDDFWYLGQHFQARDETGAVVGRRTFISDSFVVGNQRERVKMIEAWYRMPESCDVCSGDVFDEKAYDPSNPLMKQAVESGAVNLYKQVRMRMRVAMFTEDALLHLGPTPYRHDKYPFTPIVCYMRGRDKMPYGPIRRVRDIQEDLNKRASKALFHMSTNQIFGSQGDVDDWDALREEVDRPDGNIVTNPGRKIEVRRDMEMAKGHLEIMTMDAAKIQRGVGINDENLGNQTNATSGKAIEARQLQGSVATTQPFDNLRFAVHAQGRKRLSLAEQYLTAPKVLRIVGSMGAVQWVKINQPEMQADGSVRWLNDITASEADFIVDEQDFHGSLRQAMFESMMGLAAKLPPEMALRLLRMAFDYSDMPNKDEIVSEIRRITGEQEPTEKMAPEERQALADQQAQRQEVQAMQQKAAILALEEQQAKVAKLNAEAQEIAARAAVAGGNGEATAKFEAQIRQVQSEAAAQIDELTGKLVDAQREFEDRLTQVRRDADSQHEIERIRADGQIRVAEVNKEASKELAALMSRMDELSNGIQDIGKQVADAAAQAEKAEKEKPVKPEKPETPPASPPAPNVTITLEAGAIQVDAKTPSVSKTIEGVDGKGNKIKLTVKPKAEKE